MTTDFAKLQADFAGHLRNPDQQRPPADIEDRRLKIYRELIYNNIENFLASGFPILKSILVNSSWPHSSVAYWQELVRDFMVRHRSESPYFLKISEEFLHYLNHLRPQAESAPLDPPFMAQLAHYEWLELALDVSTDELSPEQSSLAGRLLEQDDDSFLSSLIKTGVKLSPLAILQAYDYPVHHLGEDKDVMAISNHPQPTYLLVFRDYQDTIAFVELNGPSFRLLQLLMMVDGECSETSGSILLAAESLALEMTNFQATQLLGFSLPLIKNLLARGALVVF